MTERLAGTEMYLYSARRISDTYRPHGTDWPSMWLYDQHPRLYARCCAVCPAQELRLLHGINNDVVLTIPSGPMGRIDMALLHNKCGPRTDGVEGHKTGASAHTRASNACPLL